MLRDEGASPDAIDAVLAAGVEEPMELVIARVRALEAARTDARDAFDDLATAYARANNLRRRGAGRRRWTRRCMGEAERALALLLWDVADAACRAALAADDYAARPGGPGGPARRPSTRFFEDVLVMDEDAAAAREPAAPAELASWPCSRSVADFGKMAKGGK